MITKLRLRNFRSYEDISFDFETGVNIIAGPNASGKTNLLEAVLVLARGSSYRVKDRDLVRHDQPWTRIDGQEDTDTRTVKIVLDPGASKQYEIDGRVFKRLPTHSSLPAVLFEPEDLRLLSGSPERRRDYMDDLLEQSQAGYGTLRRKYKRALAQRNNLLKNSAPASHIFPWDVRLAGLAGQIVRARRGLVDRLAGELPGLYRKISVSVTEVYPEYQGRWPVENYESRLVKELEESLELDRARGFTGAGPHREDLAVSFDGRPAQETASRGEIRTAVLALKVAELKIIEEERQKAPLLLLDDVFSELDKSRRHALTDYLSDYQTFITTTDADAVIGDFPKSHVISLSGR